MIERTLGIVLHQLRYADTKVIVTMFTERRGAVSFLVRLPRNRRSAVNGLLLTPLSLLEVDIDYQETARLQRLVDVRVSEPYRSLPYNPMKQTIALFLGEFLYYSLREEQANPELFAYLLRSLLWLDNRPREFANFPPTFLIRLSRFLGFWPNVDTTSLRVRRYSISGTAPHAGLVFDLVEAEMKTTLPPHGAYLGPEEAVFVPLLLRMDYATMHLFRFSRQQRTRLLHVLNDYYRLHVPHFPQLKSMAILREVLG